MNLWLEFADSEVAEAQLLDGTTPSLVLRLSAAALRIDGEAGTAASASRSGIARGVRLELTGLTDRPGPLTLPDGCFGRLAHGRVEAGGAWSGRLPLPGVLAGPIRLELAWSNGTALALQTDASGRLSSAFTGAPNVHESLAC